MVEWHVEKADARSCRRRDRRMPGARLHTRVLQRRGAVRGRGLSKMAAKRPGEDLMAGESGSGGDADHGLRTRHQPRGRVFETQSLRVLLRGFTSHSTERPVEVKWRPPGPGGDRGQRNVAVKAPANVAE